MSESFAALVQGEPVEALIANNGDVLGYYREDGSFVRRDYLRRQRRVFDLGDVAQGPVTLPIQWFKYEGPWIPVDDVLELEECAAHDDRWRVHQALQERAETMLCPRPFGDTPEVPEVTTAFAAQRVVETNNERAAAAGCPNGLTPEAWENIVADFAGQCAYCGARKRLVLEHVIPISAGGGTTVDNVVPACCSCNSKKRNREPVGWLTEDPERVLTFIDAVAWAEVARE